MCYLQLESGSKWKPTAGWRRHIATIATLQILSYSAKEVLFFFKFQNSAVLPYMLWERWNETERHPATFEARLELFSLTNRGRNEMMNVLDDFGLNLPELFLLLLFDHFFIWSNLLILDLAGLGNPSMLWMLAMLARLFSLENKNFKIFTSCHFRQSIFLSPRLAFQHGRKYYLK